MDTIELDFAPAPAVAFPRPRADCRAEPSHPMDKLVITYCDCTDDASSAAIADELYKLGYDRDKVKILSGGSLRWVELKYPVEGKK